MRIHFEFEGDVAELTSAVSRLIRAIDAPVDWSFTPSDEAEPPFAPDEDKGQPPLRVVTSADAEASNPAFTDWTLPPPPVEPAEPPPPPVKKEIDPEEFLAVSNYAPFNAFVASWMQGFDEEDAEQPDRVALLGTLSGKDAFQILDRAATLGALQHLVTTALARAHHPRWSDIDFVDRVSAHIAQVGSAGGFYELVGMHDHSEKWKAAWQFHFGPIDAMINATLGDEPQTKDQKETT